MKIKIKINEPMLTEPDLLVSMGGVYEHNDLVEVHHRDEPGVSPFAYPACYIKFGELNIESLEK